MKEVENKLEKIKEKINLIDYDSLEWKIMYK